MSAAREKDAADYDLERFIDMFDQVMISDDPRVKNALRQLMMMVILTDTGDHEAEQRVRQGPLRQLQQDIRDQFRWIQRLEQEIQSLKMQMNLNQGQAKAGGGYRAQNVGTSLPSTDYWQSVVAQTNQLKQKGLEINPSTLNNLNIKIAQDTGGTDA